MRNIEYNKNNGVPLNMAIITKYSTPYPYTNGTGPMTDIGSIFTENTTQVIAGNGLTGGGSLSTSRTINVVGGTCIAVDANSVKHSAPAAGVAASRTAQANQTLSELSFDTFGHTTKASWATRNLDSWGTTISALTISNDLLVNGNTTLKLDLAVDGDTTLNNLSIDGIVKSNIVISNPAQSDPHLTIGSSYDWNPGNDKDSPYIRFNGTRSFYMGSDFEDGFYIDPTASGDRQNARLNIDTSGNTVFHDDLQQGVFKLNRNGNSSIFTGNSGQMILTVKNTKSSGLFTERTASLVLTNYATSTTTNNVKLIYNPSGSFNIYHQEDNTIGLASYDSGVVQLFHDGSTKLSTNSAGVSVTGIVSCTSNPTADNHLTRKSYVDGLAGSNSRIRTETSTLWSGNYGSNSTAYVTLNDNPDNYDALVFAGAVDGSTLRNAIYVPIEVHNLSMANSSNGNYKVFSNNNCWLQGRTTSTRFYLSNDNNAELQRIYGIKYFNN